MTNTPKTESPHTLIVGEDPEDLEIEHPDTCVFHPGVSEEGKFHSIPYYECGVDFEISNCGLTYFFDHIDNKPEDDTNWTDPVYLEPGKYQIEYWYDSWTHWEYGPEHESGIRLIEDA